MSNIDKRQYRADGGDIGTDRIREIADNPYGDEEKCWLAKRVLELLDELEADGKRIAELTDALMQMINAHKTTIRSGYERIIECGGDCDSPEMMISESPEIIMAEAVLKTGIKSE